MRQAPDPWDRMAEKYPPGTLVEGTVRELTNYGVFVEIEEGIAGLLHVSDVSWVRKVSSPYETFKIGQKVKCIILAVDQDRQRIAFAQTSRLFFCRSLLFRRRCSLVSCSRNHCAARAKRSLVVRRGRRPTTERGESPQPSRLPNGKSKLGQLNTPCRQQEFTMNEPDLWLLRLSGSALSRTTSFRRNERNPT